MGETKPDSAYKTGDRVRIVEAPYDDCPFTWVEDMDEYCGTEVTITTVYWYNGRKCYGYSIKEDDGACTWCEGCFKPLFDDIDIEDSGEDFSMLFS